MREGKGEREVVGDCVCVHVHACGQQGGQEGRELAGFSRDAPLKLLTDARRQSRD